MGRHTIKLTTVALNRLKKYQQPGQTISDVIVNLFPYFDKPIEEPVSAKRTKRRKG